MRVTGCSVRSPSSLRTTNFDQLALRVPHGERGPPWQRQRNSGDAAFADALQQIAAML